MGISDHDLTKDEKTKSTQNHINQDNVSQTLVMYLQSLTPAAQQQFWQKMFSRLQRNNLLNLPEKKQANQTDANKNKVKSANRFQKFIQFFPLPIVITDAHGNFEYINQAFTAKFGYTQEDVPNDKIWSLKAYPDQDYRKQILLTIAQPGYDPKAPRERQIMCKNGEKRIAILQDITIKQENLTFFRDITSQRQVEAEVQKKEREYREIVENSQDLIIVLDFHERILRVNPAVADYLGHSNEKLQGTSIYEILDPKYHPRVQKMMPRKLEGEMEKRVYEVEFISIEGDRIPFEMMSRVIFKEETQVGTLLIARDIRQRKKIAEEQLRQQKIESIGLLAGGIAHDFNNILVSILGNINLLQFDDENCTEEQKTILNEMETATLQARDLAGQLLTFAKGGKPILKQTNISELMEETISFVLRGTNCTSEINIDSDLPDLQIDPSQMKQVIQNLIINARQAMSQGGTITVGVKTHTVTKNAQLPLSSGTYVKIIIKDHGIGIPARLRSKIFDPYFTTKKGGTGLGLTVSYNIIQKHGGYLTFQSEVGQGTTFEIYLPIIAPELSEMGKTPMKAIDSEKKKTILVLDDEEKIHTLLKRAFTKWEYQIISCYDGAEVLTQLEQSNSSYETTHEENTKNRHISIDLIFLDLVIPNGMGGLDTMKEIQARFPAQKVIVFSGYSDDPVLANYTEYGFCDFLVKPFPLNQLKTLLEKWI